MSIYVEFDEQSFEATNLARQERPTHRGKWSIDAEIPRSSSFSGDAPTRERSVAHSNRYA